MYVCGIQLFKAFGLMQGYLPENVPCISYFLTYMLYSGPTMAGLRGKFSNLRSLPGKCHFQVVYCKLITNNLGAI